MKISHPRLVCPSVRWHLVFPKLSKIFLPAIMVPPSTPKSHLPLLLSCFSSLFRCLTAFQITGALGGINETTGQRPLRYEIHEFANSGPAFDLFIIALADFQNSNQSDPLSYFQISGLPDLHLLQPYTYSWQESTATLKLRGMVSQEAVAILDFACMLRRRFRLGIDLMWHYMRYLPFDARLLVSHSPLHALLVSFTFTADPSPSSLTDHFAATYLAARPRHCKHISRQPT